MSTIVATPVRVKPPPADTGEIISPGCASLEMATPSNGAAAGTMPTESRTDDAASSTAATAASAKKPPNYTAVLAEELIELGRDDRRIVGITAGMPTGTGMARFEAAYPDRGDP